MITIMQRTENERDIIRKAYDFEIKAIEKCDATTNPWYNTIMQMEEGEEVWEGINIAVEMAYGKI